eukprot:6465090-Amphidinium_carterae.1
MLGLYLTVSMACKSSSLTVHSKPFLSGIPPALGSLPTSPARHARWPQLCNAVITMSPGRPST